MPEQHSQPIIEVANLGKKYIINHQQQRERYGSLRDTLAAGFRRAIARGTSGQSTREEFWALRDVSFAVQRGDVVGIIGRNGAGKSTLLKVLSRITEPTTGEVTLRGRVASLLEVGTGFHPELSGRENIYLNGTILGMKRTEIRRKFQEIVDFAEIEQFLDTPVKRYSSGMYMRLAFAIAAHLEPEILVVDEVLAVGDIEFQKKCFGKMGEVAASGRTVLFVSHNTGAIQRMCTRAIVLKRGQVAMEGDVNRCLSYFLAPEKSAENQFGVADLADEGIVRRGSGDARFDRIELIGKDGRTKDVFQTGEPFRIRLTIRSKLTKKSVVLGCSFVASDGVEVMGTSAHDGGIESDLVEGENVFECLIDPMVLVPGNFGVRAAIFAATEVFDHIDELLKFQVDRSQFDSERGPRDHFVGYVYLPFSWSKLSRVGS